MILVPHYDVPEFVGVPHESTVVSADYAKKNPDTVRAMVRAMAKGRKLLFDEPEKAAKLMESKFKSTDPVLLAQGVKIMRKAYGGDPGLLSQKELDTHVAFAAKAKMLKGPIAYQEGIHWTNDFFR